MLNGWPEHNGYADILMEAIETSDLLYLSGIEDMGHEISDRKTKKPFR